MPIISLNWSLKRVFGSILTIFIVILTLFNIRKTSSESSSNLRGKTKTIVNTTMSMQGICIPTSFLAILCWHFTTFVGGRVLTSFLTSSSKFPFTLYGTAWKKEATASLVELALKNGFRSIDTACMCLTHSHYLPLESLTNLLTCRSTKTL